jgi:hypothetical protein
MLWFILALHFRACVTVCSSGCALHTIDNDTNFAFPPRQQTIVEELERIRREVACGSGTKNAAMLEPSIGHGDAAADIESATAAIFVELQRQLNDKDDVIQSMRAHVSDVRRDNGDLEAQLHIAVQETRAAEVTVHCESRALQL